MSETQNRLHSQTTNEDIDLRLFFNLGEANTTKNKNLNISETKEKMNITDGINLNGYITLINGVKKKTNTRFRNMINFESYIQKN